MPAASPRTSLLSHRPRRRPPPDGYRNPGNSRIVKLSASPMRLPSLALISCLLIALPAVAQQPPPAQADLVPGNFVDITAKTGIHFQGRASHTSKKYLIETMG